MSKTIEVTINDCTLTADNRCYMLTHKPRGRLCRLGDADPFTNAQRGLMLAKQVEWIPESVTPLDLLNTDNHAARMADLNAFT